MRLVASFAFLLLPRSLLVQCQSDGVCSRTLSVVNNTVSADKCDCPNGPICTPCNISTTSVGSRGVVICDSGCEYCDPAQTFCGTFGYRYSRWETFDTFGSAIVPNYRMAWTYTKGRTGTVIYTFSKLLPTADATCSVQVNGQFCQSCTIRRCRADDSLEPRINCTNLEAGATAGSEEFICKGRTNGGSVSLDDSALDGILAPLGFPFYHCKLGRMVLRQNQSSPVVTMPLATPVSVPVVGPIMAQPAMGPPIAVSAPMAAPAPPVGPNSPKCGLFRLGIVCWRGCGWIRRTLGLCAE